MFLPIAAASVLSTLDSRLSQQWVLTHLAVEAVSCMPIYRQLSRTLRCHVGNPATTQPRRTDAELAWRVSRFRGHSEAERFTSMKLLVRFSHTTKETFSSINCPSFINNPSFPVYSPILCPTSVLSPAFCQLPGDIW